MSKVKEKVHIRTICRNLLRRGRECSFRTKGRKNSMAIIIMHSGRPHHHTGDKSPPLPSSTNLLTAPHTRHNELAHNNAPRHRRKNDLPRLYVWEVSPAPAMCAFGRVEGKNMKVCNHSVKITPHDNDQKILCHTDVSCV
jgi:hypothetical protein